MRARETFLFWGKMVSLATYAVGECDGRIWGQANVSVDVVFLSITQLVFEPS